jgi:hypothetical protein
MGADGSFVLQACRRQGGGFVNPFARQMSQKRHAHVAFHAERLTVRPHTPRAGRGIRAGDNRNA